jgi:ankyrin repeat protein
MSEQTLSLKEKSQDRWNEIFNHFISDERFKKAINNPGKHVPSPFNHLSKKDGFRLDPDFDSKNGLGYDNSIGSMSGVEMIAKHTGQDITTTAAAIHKFIDGRDIELGIQRDPEEVKKQARAREQAILEKQADDLEKAQDINDQVLSSPKNNEQLKTYLSGRGFDTTIVDNINPTIFATDGLYYDKDNNYPAMVAPVVNNKGETVFLHRTFLDGKGNKADVAAAKKVTPKLTADAYQNPYFVQVNNAPKSNTIHVAEGIETALAVSAITNNKDQVLSTINTDGMAKFMPTDKNSNVVIWADNDTGGIKAANTLQERLNKEGITASINIPKTQGNDFLDEYLQAKKQNIDLGKEYNTQAKNEQVVVKKPDSANNSSTQKQEVKNYKVSAKDTWLLRLSKYSITPTFVINRLAKTNNKQFLNEALIEAAKHNNIKTLQNLLKNGADINFNSSIGNALNVAIANNNNKIVNTLLAQDNINLDIVDYNGNTPLINAIASNNKIANQLLNYNIDTNIVNKNGDNALSLAVSNNNVQMVKELLTKGTLATNTNADKNPLIIAASKSPEMLKVFAINNSFAHQDINGNTALNLAIKNNANIKTIESLTNVMTSKDIAIKDNKGNTALISATKLLNNKTVKALIDKSDINSKDNNGQTALHHAVLNADNKSIDLFVKHDADVNIADNRGNTALHLAVEQGNKTAKHLIANTKDINAQNLSGDSALTIAARDNNLKAVVSLLRAGARTDIANNLGTTPKDAAKKLSLTNAVLTLYDRSRKIDQRVNGIARETTAKAITKVNSGISYMERLQAKRAKEKTHTRGVRH